MKKLVERRNRKLEKATERLNALAPQVRGNRPTVTTRGDRLYLTCWLQDRRENFASFEKPSELATVLVQLSRAEPVTAEEFHQEKVRLWAEENSLAEQRKALVRRAWELNFPEAALQQQEIMERAWAVKGKERLCAISRGFLHVFCVLPEHAGIDFERHDPAAENPDDPVPSADCDWLSGEFLIRDVRNFPAVYARASLWPRQNYVAELRRFHTKNVWCVWERVVDGEIIPLMAKIKEERIYRAPWRELVRQVKTLLAPWSIPRQWPMKRVERTGATRVVLRAPNRLHGAGETVSA
jgi:hypothetical protein